VNNILFAIATIVVLVSLLGGCEELQTTKRKVTTSFTSLSPQEAYDLMNNSVNLTIIDCSSCQCSYNRAHIVDAIWDDTPSHYYNLTTDVLAYCQNGAVSLAFCNELVNHTYGEIFHIAGGFSAWKATGFKTVKPD
jgi:rhodanese-related sulfurtransferase